MDQILIEQYLGSDCWVELIIVDIEDGATRKETLEAVSTLGKQLADSKTMFMTKEDGFCIVITRENGPVRLTLL